MVFTIAVLSGVAAEQAREGFSMEKRLSLFQRVVYIFFGFSGVVSIIATTNYLRTNPPIKVFFPSLNYGCLNELGSSGHYW
jgi:hypothetical protein